MRCHRSTTGERALEIDPIELEQSLLTLPVMESITCSWVTESSSGQQMLKRLRLAAQTPLALYLWGETGVGKELLARQAHLWSAQCKGPFIPLHCASLSPQIAESELFGHTRGAFTGAMHTRSGALFTAQNGTLFLDEVAELSLELQVKLLRFLENGEYRPIGSDRVEFSNARIICATHRDLGAWVAAGKFREDLYFRLAGITIQIPPLRLRVADIAAQAKRFALEQGFLLSSDSANALEAHSWPGNSRELKRCVQSAVFLRGIPRRESGAPAVLCPKDFDLKRAPGTLREPETLNLVEMERMWILKALRAHHGNRESAAAALGIARSTLFQRLRRYGVHAPLRVAIEAEAHHHRISST